MGEAQRWQFGPFIADATEQRLWCGDRHVPVTRKAFALLLALLRRPARLVTKAELFGSVWSGSVVTDAALSRAIRELRLALGDAAGAPLYIETAHGLGFRFIAELIPQPSPPVAVTASAGVAAAAVAAMAIASQPSPAGRASTLVGRESDLHTLENALTLARGGRRQLVFVSGEPGVGKTALVEAFIARQKATDIWAAQGRCIEQFGAREAHLPILEALERLAAQVGPEALRQTLARYAPSWLVHLPWLMHGAGAGADPVAAAQAATGTSAQGMLREIAQALEVLSQRSPIVLWFEDLHWSDPSSVDVLSFLAGREDAARLLIIASYRPADAQRANTPLRTVVQALALRGLCQQMPLQRLDEQSVVAYLRARFGHSPRLATQALAQFIHRRTDGNALFTVATVDDLVRRGDVADEGDGWHLKWRVEELATAMPASLRQLILGQLEQLADADRRLLEAAAVAGAEFSAAAVAAALTCEVSQVEDRCAQLAASGTLLRSSSSVAWPDGTVAAGFAFLHALYWQALYDQVPETRRADWQRRIGLREEQAFGPQVAQIASQLAMRFEVAHDMPRCVAYLQQAGAGALSRCAYQEGIELLSHALELVPRLARDDQPRQELDLLLPLGAARMAAAGYASGEVQAIYQRALALCRTCARPGELDRSLRGLWNVALVRADLAQALALAQELLTRAQASGRLGPRFDAHAKLGQTSMHRGELLAARKHLEQALALPIDADDANRLREAPRVAAYLAWVLWYGGQADQAVRHAEQALVYAKRAASPHSSAFALGFAAWLYVMRGDLDRAGVLTQQQLQQCAEHGLPYWRCWGEFTEGLLIARGGDGRSGLARMDRAIQDFFAMDANVGLPQFLDLYAQACLEAGHHAKAQAALAASAELVQRTGNGYQAAETARLQGELAWAMDGSEGGGQQASAHLERALHMAEHSGALALQLRAATSLARLSLQRGQAALGIDALDRLCLAFTEGANTADLMAARRLLAALRPALSLSPSVPNSSHHLL